MKMTDDNGDTTLHNAVRSKCVGIVKMLVKEDPEFEYPANQAGETPLYPGAEPVFWANPLVLVQTLYLR